MKKHITFIAVLLLFCCHRAVAQDWIDALKKVATTAADNATGGKLTQYALVGTWKYTSPGVKFESDNMLSELGGAAVETTVTNRLEKVYKMVGITEGACYFTFTKENTFSATMGARTLTGTYEFDASTHVISLTFDKLKIGAVPGHAYISGSGLQLVFPVTKLVNMVTAMGSKVSSLASVSKMLENYKNVYLGFEFTKD